MNVYGYGEDALTLWAFHNQFQQILSQLEDDSSLEGCTLFFRPSFGRRGGEGSAQFGEFDFILLTEHALYLGEAKWDRSPESSSRDEIHLRTEQITRHTIFRQYVNEWTCGPYSTWEEFLSAAMLNWPAERPMAPNGRLLSENLQKVLRTIHVKYQGTPKIQDVLLYLHDGRSTEPIPTAASANFRPVYVDYSSAKFGNYIKM